jgi:hypothetical protein
MHSSQHIQHILKNFHAIKTSTSPLQWKALLFTSRSYYFHVYSLRLSTSSLRGKNDTDTLL